MNGPTQPPRRPPRSLVIALSATLAALAADLSTKEWALERLSFAIASPHTARPLCQADAEGRVPMQRLRKPAITIADGYLDLRYAENCGAAFGLLRRAPRGLSRSIFGIAAIVASVALGWMLVRGHGGPLFAAAAPLVISGALGNFVDRVRHGYVVDFVRFHLHDTWEWPTFNVADAAITVGVVLLVLDGLRKHGGVAHTQR